MNFASRIANRGLRAATSTGPNPGLLRLDSRHDFSMEFAFCFVDANGLCEYAVGMGLIRILVDGYSLLHHWPELAEGAKRHSEAARDALVEILTRYSDASGTPVTVFFDGNSPRRGKPAATNPGTVEVLFSHQGQTADDLIERAAHLYQSYGEVLVVTDDRAEGRVADGFGAHVVGSAIFINMMGEALENLAEKLKQHNETEKRRFVRPI